MRTATLIVVLVALVPELTGAQQPKPAFEVASVKRNLSGGQASGGATPTGFSVVNWTLSQLMATAYELGDTAAPFMVDCSGTPLNDRLAALNKLPDAALRTAGSTCATTDSLAFQIELTLNAAVVDETGLSGRWDYVISSNGLESGMRRAGDGTMREYPSIFKAVEEQLGLKLERSREKAPFDVLVIKSVELPSEN